MGRRNDEKLDDVKLTYAVSPEGKQRLISERPPKFDERAWTLFQTRADRVVVRNTTYIRTEFRAHDDPPGIYVTYREAKRK